MYINLKNFVTIKYALFYRYVLRHVALIKAILYEN